MKGVDDPEFILLQKAKEIRNRTNNPEEIDELIRLAENIINQNFKGAITYMMMALQYVDLSELDKMIKLLEEAAHK